MHWIRVLENIRERALPLCATVRGEEGGRRHDKAFVWAEAGRIDGEYKDSQCSGSIPATLFGAWRETCAYPERVVPALFARSNVQLSQPAVRLTARTYHGEKIWFGNVPWVRPELKLSVEHLIHSNKHGLEVCLEVSWERGGGWSRSKEVAQEATHLEGEDQLYVG